MQKVNSNPKPENKNENESGERNPNLSTRKKIPHEILVELVARSPLREIVRFKSVSKKFKWETESAYFRRLFFS